MMATCDTALAQLEGLLQPRELDALHQAGLGTVGDLLMRLPRRYEDRRSCASLSELSLGEPSCVRVQIYSACTRFSFKPFFEAAVGEPGDTHGARLYLRWFHMPWLSKLLAVGQHLFVYGKLTSFGSKLCMMNPDFEIQEDDTGLRLAQLAMGDNWSQDMVPSLEGAVQESAIAIHTDRIVPIYRNISGLSTRRYRELVWNVLLILDPSLKPAIYDVAPQYSMAEAFHDLHFPTEDALSRKARMRFALSECFLQQVKVQWRRMHAKRQEGQVCVTTRFYVEELLASLPFSLTGAQLRCIEEIAQDMRQPEAMNRLLQGDVGSGKTLVALCAMLMAFESGKNAALMAPTQILAQQHYQQFCRLLQGMDIPLYLRTAEAVQDNGVRPVGSDGPALYVGTHALLYKKNKVDELGLAVIDEQHKFGVQQRELFTKLALQPDVLVMSATPIPRTLTLTLYGDLDVSIIDELPARRGKVVTALRNPKKMERIIAFLKDELAQGRQIYIVSPLVEENEKRAQHSATQELDRWRSQFPQEEVVLLHGRMSGEEKDAAMQAFKANEASILVATSVIEVGVDVPNATVMMINDADCFGLSQLHQLRGRIGRGSLKSYCILLSKAKAGEPSYDKLQLLCRTSNGFEIAEEDFVMRGPGDVLGTAQSGLGTVLFPEWLSNMRLLHRARQEAQQVLDQDPDLRQVQHAALRDLMLSQSSGSVTA